MTKYYLRGVRFFDDPEKREWNSILRMYPDCGFRELSWYAPGTTDLCSSGRAVGFYRHRPLRGGFAICEERTFNTEVPSLKGVTRLRSALTAPQCDRVLHVIQKLEGRGETPLSGMGSKNQFFKTMRDSRMQMLECEWEDSEGAFGGTAGILLESGKHFSAAEVQMNRAYIDDRPNSKRKHWLFIYNLPRCCRLHVKCFFENTNIVNPLLGSPWIYQAYTSERLELMDFYDLREAAERLDELDMWSFSEMNAAAFLREIGGRCGFGKTSTD